VSAKSSAPRLTPPNSGRGPVIFKSPRADENLCQAPEDGGVKCAASELEGAAEMAQRSIRVNAAQLSGELARLHMQAIDAVRDSVLATLRLARAVSEAAAGDAIALHPIANAAAMRHAALFFYQSALGVIGAAAMNGRAPNRPTGEPASEPDDAFLAHYAALTPQQKTVLALICEGHANKLIAYRLGICESTVKAHVSRILRVLRTPSRTRAIALMARRGASIDPLPAHSAMG
jgi:DNA-binding NarL/FixJ family response regulator